MFDSALGGLHTFLRFDSQQKLPMNPLDTIMTTLNISGDELGRMVGLDGSTIRKYRKEGPDALRTMRDRENLIKIAQALGTTPAHLTAIDIVPDPTSMVDEVRAASAEEIAAVPKAFRRMATPKNSEVVYFVLCDALSELGIEAGELIKVDVTAVPEQGSSVLVEVTPPGKPEARVRLLRQFVPPRLYVTNRSNGNEVLSSSDEGLNLTVLGVLV
jgi:hypothetical protein